MATNDAQSPIEHGGWIRLLYIVLFAIILRIADGISTLIALLQFLINLFRGQPNERLSAFGGNLGQYVAQIVHFLTYHSAEMPFPFSAWPGPLIEGAASTEVVGKKEEPPE